MLVGYTAKAATSTGEAVSVGATFAPLDPTTVDGALNEDTDSNNDGAIKNDSGESKTVEGIMAISADMANRDIVLTPMSSTDGISFSEINAAYQVEFKMIGDPSCYMIQYKATIANGSYLAIGAKDLTGASTLTCHAYYHYIREITAEYPTIIGRCGTDFGESTENSEGSLSTTLKESTFTTTDSAINKNCVGNNDSTLASDTATTTIVDGFFFGAIYKSQTGARNFTFAAGVDEGSGSSQIPASGGGVAYRASTDPMFLFGWYTYEISEDDVIYPFVGVTSSTSAAMRVSTFEHFMRSRT